MARVDVDTSGPIFDGRAKNAAHDFSKKVAEKVAEKGEEMVRQQLHSVIRHPTGYYESHIQTEVLTELNRVITDGGVVYGPWLEGTGSRNDTTRFKGYKTFRLISHELESKTSAIAEQLLPYYTSRME